MLNEQTIVKWDKNAETDLRNGLTKAQVKERQTIYGPNRLREGKKKSVLKLFWEQLNDPLIYILMAAIAISLFLGEAGESMIIAAVIILNAVVGVIQEGKAIKAIEALQQLSSPKALVKRDGREMEIPGSELVPGDLIFLEAGRQVPADGRLLTASGLQIDEAALTGESVAVDKEVLGQKKEEKVDDRGTGKAETVSSEEEKLHAAEVLGDQKHLVFMTTMVTAGHGEAIVTETGMQTQIGKIAGMISESREELTPLQKRLADLGKILSLVAVGICVFLFVVAVLQKRDIGEMLLTAISLAVAAVPEGLAAIVTVVLALSVSRMVRVGTIVRKLPSVETLGAVDVVCSDKTGTLTCNRMTVKQCYVDGRLLPVEEFRKEEHEEFLNACVLCNNALLGEENIGDPTELALLILAEECGREKENTEKEYVRISECAFDSVRKKMTTIHKSVNGEVAYSKGAADRILKDCRTVWKNGKEADFSEKAKNEAQRAMEQMASGALRVIALAMKKKGDLKEEKDLVFLGLAGMMDPPREESKDAVTECIKAGIKPIMITGDHKVTAAAIARRIGILKEDSEACEGAVIEEMSDEELQEFVEGISVYARVSPEHKIRIVRAWQEKGNIVAMTGDGVNDAPALKQADIGVAMGITGTEVAKDAASMVLTDDNFATIIKAVENGRNVYKNIKNAIQFLLSGNFGGILTVLFASIAGLPVPFAPVHLLFINLLTDSLPAIALGMEPHTNAVMEEKPRPKNESILTKDFLFKIGTEGLCIGVITMLAFLIGLREGGSILGSTMAFGTLCTGRLVHGFNCKSDRPVIFTNRFFNNRYLTGAFLLGLFFITAVMLIPGLQSVFKVVSLDLGQLFTVYGLAFLNLPIIQILKKMRK